MTVTKRELIKRVEGNTGLLSKESRLIVESVLQNIIVSLLNGEKVEIRGFGSFRLRKKRARIGMNPRTGERGLRIPEKTVIYFRAGKDLRDKLGSQ